MAILTTWLKKSKRYYCHPISNVFAIEWHHSKCCVSLPSPTFSRSQNVKCEYLKKGCSRQICLELHGLRHTVALVIRKLSTIHTFKTKKKQTFWAILHEVCNFWRRSTWSSGPPLTHTNKTCHYNISFIIVIKKICQGIFLYSLCTSLLLSPCVSIVCYFCLFCWLLNI